MKLKMRPYMHEAKGPGLAGENAIAFEVELPNRRAAYIGKFGATWKVLPDQSAGPRDWQGEYRTAEDALAALQAEVDKPTTLDRTHWNGITTWVRQWADGVDYGIVPRSVDRPENVHHLHTVDDAKAAADRLAHPGNCTEKCGSWLPR